MSWLDSVFGRKADVAQPTYTQLPAEQLKAIGANVKAFPDISKLGDLYSQYLQGGIEKLIPQYKDLFSKAGEAAGSALSSAIPLLQGQLDPATIGQYGRLGAFQNLGSGLIGGPAGTANQLRTLGLGTLEGEQKGLNLLLGAGNSAQQWMNQARSTIQDPATFEITPAQQAAQTAANNLLKQNYQQYKYNVEAAPTPWAKGVSDTLIGLIGAYLGAGRGGGSGLTQAYPNLQSGIIGQAQTGTGGYENVYGSPALPYDSQTGGYAGGYVPYLNETSSGSPADINVNLPPLSSTYDFPGAGARVHFDAAGNFIG